MTKLSPIGLNIEKSKKKKQIHLKKDGKKTKD